MIADLAILILLTFAGAVTMLLLLILWFGDKAIQPEIESDLDPILGARDQAVISDSQGPFIPMPGHLKTRDEMVDWMTKELPKLTARAP